MKKVIFSVAFPTLMLVFYSFFRLNAQETDNIYRYPAGIYVYTDQDIFPDLIHPKRKVAFNEDRNYTMGMIIGYFGMTANSDYWGVPFLRKQVDRFLGFDCRHCENDAISRATMFILGNAFTPLDIERTDVIKGDRPYASLLLLGSSFTSVDEDAGLSLTTELGIGALGLNHGKVFQSTIHREHWLGSTRPVPLGWHNQISNGGEPTFLYRVNFRKRFFEQNWSSEKYPAQHRFQLIGTGEGMVGYYNNVAAGVEARVGYFSNPFWDMVSGVGSGMNQNPSTQVRQAPVEFFLFGGLRTRVVAYNALLQGQFRRTNYRMYANQINRVIGEFEYGVGLKVWKVQVLAGLLAGRTPEYRGAYERPHLWGSFMLRANWLVPLDERKTRLSCDHCE